MHRPRQPPLRNIYIYYMFSTDWYCQFLEADLKTTLPRKFRFSTSDKVIELAERGRGLKDLACKQALEHGIGIGCGGVHLYLTDEQYNKLKRCAAEDQVHEAVQTHRLWRRTRLDTVEGHRNRMAEAAVTRAPVT